MQGAWVPSIWEWMPDWGRKGILRPWNVSECPPPRGPKHRDTAKPTSRGAMPLGSQSSGPQAASAGDAHTFGPVELPVRGPGHPQGKLSFLKRCQGTSLGAEWLRLHARRGNVSRLFYRRQLHLCFMRSRGHRLDPCARN